MPRAIISPSVLASDFGQLTAECKRMIKGGAEWLHMGAFILSACFLLLFNADATRSSAQMLWTGDYITCLLPPSSSTTNAWSLAISCPTSPWVCLRAPSFSSITTSYRSPSQRRTHSLMRVQRRPWYFHGLPYDGRRTRESTHRSLLQLYL